MVFPRILSLWHQVWHCLPVGCRMRQTFTREGLKWRLHTPSCHASVTSFATSSRISLCRIVGKLPVEQFKAWSTLKGFSTCTLSCMKGDLKVASRISRASSCLLTGLIHAPFNCSVLVTFCFGGSPIEQLNL